MGGKPEPGAISARLVRQAESLHHLIELMESGEITPETVCLQIKNTEHCLLDLRNEIDRHHWRTIDDTTAKSSAAP